MKTLYFIAILFATFFMSSCSEDALDVNLKTTLTKDIDLMNSSAARTAKISTGVPFDKSVTLSLDNEDTNKYLKKIKSVKVKKMTYIFTDFTGADHVKIVSADLQADGASIHSISDLIIKNAITDNTVFEVTNVTANISKIETALLNNKAITIRTVGNFGCSCAMSFKIRISIDLELVANPL